MAKEMSTIYIGNMVDCREDWSIRIEERVLVVRGNSIQERAEVGELASVMERYRVQEEEVIHLSSSQFLLPGLIDTHIHASQFPNAGLALDLPLLNWLDAYTFPTEARFAKPDISRKVYERCVRSTLDSGTTTAAYFATIHRESSEILGGICHRLGQRAFVGKVCMDRNSPDYYVETTEDSLQQTEEFVNKIEGLGSELVRPIITPRFVPSCSRKLLSGLGKLASDRKLHVQTHVSENKKEVEWVKEIEGDCDHYTQVYERSGLLGSRTILAHGVHLTDTELNIIRESGAGVSHCPNSNFSLKSGVCDVTRLKRAGVKVGLGTDCSGGYSSSIINSMRLAVLASNTVVFSPEGGAGHSPLGYSDVLYLATRGGARLLNMEDRLGSLDTAKLADFLIIDMKAQQSTQLFGHESLSDIVHKFVFLGDDRNVVQVVVNGRKVKDTRVGPQG